MIWLAMIAGDETIAMNTSDEMIATITSNNVISGQYMDGSFAV
jgi:hypothetical protein